MTGGTVEVTKAEAIILARALNTVTVSGIATQRQVIALFEKLATFVDTEEKVSNGDELQKATE